MNNKKPIVFVQGRSSYYSENNYVQHIILKALSQGITDPKELRKIAGLEKVADVYRTLDKMALRKEYHQALSSAGISFDFIVNGIKQLATGSESDMVKLASFQTLLKSLGLDKYEKLEDSGRSWEEAIIAATDPSEEKVVIEDYEVKVPEVPEAELKRREEEKKFADELYEGRY